MLNQIKSNSELCCGRGAQIPYFEEFAAGPCLLSKIGEGGGNPVPWGPVERAPPYATTIQTSFVYDFKTPFRN